MRMPFGKYKGQELADLPDDYLEWLLSLGDDLREPLHGTVRSEWTRRNPPQPVVTKMEEIITAGYRKLAPEYHPDRTGGDGEEMRDLNLAIEVLRGWVRERNTQRKS